MEKVDPIERQQILKDILVSGSIFDAIQSSGKHSTTLEMEAVAVDIYVDCSIYSSWEHLAKSLYRHHQVAAIEKLRSYLPPRGEPCYDVHMCTGY